MVSKLKLKLNIKTQEYQYDLNDPKYNLGTYSNVLMDKNLKNIISDSMSMNFIDKGAYVDIVAMEKEITKYLAFNFGGEEAIGMSLTGSSEAIVLALSMHKARKAKTSSDKKLNFVVSGACHKVFEKYALLFDVEIRQVPLNKNLSVDIKEYEKLVDEHTFCLVGIAGTTDAGMVDDIGAINKIAQKYGLPVHVDAAIGGFILPYEQNVRKWDFTLSNVRSINVSAHKYGLCVSGIGFLLLKDKSDLPGNYNGDIDYMSAGYMEDLALSCTRNAAFITNAYYNIKKLGQKGYEKITRDNKNKQKYLQEKLLQIKEVEEVFVGDTPTILLLSEKIHELSKYLRDNGWTQNAYRVRGLEKDAIRIVIKNQLTYSSLNILIKDIKDFYRS